MTETEARLLRLGERVSVGLHVSDRQGRQMRLYGTVIRNDRAKIIVRLDHCEMYREGGLMFFSVDGNQRKKWRATVPKPRRWEKVPSEEKMRGGNQ